MQGGGGSRYRGCIDDDDNAADDVPGSRYARPRRGIRIKYLGAGFVVPATHADRPQQFRIDQSAHDLQAEAGALLQGEAGRQADAVVDDPDVQVTGGALDADRPPPHRLAAPGSRARARSAPLRRAPSPAGSPGRRRDPEDCRCGAPWPLVSADATSAIDRHQLVDDLIQVHPVVRRSRQRVVHQRDGGNPAYRLGERVSHGSVLDRRACRRSSAATVCRLFFTRWWISRMVASLLSSARSRRRTSVTSLTSTSAPEGRPRGRSGRARNSTVAARASTSIRRLLRPCTAPLIAGGQFGGVERIGDQLAGQVGQVRTNHRSGQVHPVISGDGIRADVDDLRVGIKAEQPVAGPRARCGSRRTARPAGTFRPPPCGTGPRRHRCMRSPAASPPGRPTVRCPW